MRRASDDAALTWYGYDALGRRVRKRVSGMPGLDTEGPGDFYYYDGDRVVEQYAWKTDPTAPVVSDPLDDCTPPDPPPPGPVLEEKRIADPNGPKPTKTSVGWAPPTKQPTKTVKPASYKEPGDVGSAVRTADAADPASPGSPGAKTTAPTSPLYQGGTEGGTPRSDNIYSTIKEQTLTAGAPDKSGLRTVTVPDPSTVPGAPVLQKSFVYGLDYIDEVVAQIMPAPSDGSAAARRWVIQDANYNVVGLVRECDNSLIRQFRWQPYGDFERDGSGNITGIESVDSAGTVASVVQPGGTPTPTDMQSPQGFQGLWRDAETGFNYARGRIYAPPIGRFLQPDPNEQALILSSVLRRNAQTPLALASFNAQGQYGDGMSLYLGFGSNPVNRTDPSGLLTAGLDYFAEADDLESEITGQKLYTLGAINEGARWAALGLQTALDIGGSLLGVDILQSVQVLASGGGGFWESMDVFLAVAPFGPVLKAGAKLRKAAGYARRARGALIAVDKANDLARLARRIDKRSQWYKDAVRRAKQQYPKLAGKTHKHHIVPGYLGGPKDGPVVELNAAYHQWITNAFRQQRAYGLRDQPLSSRELQRIIKRVYDQYPLPE